MRASGILLHISSLPSPHGIGTMGAAAKDFVDFLVKAGQAYWQILPVCPTSYGDSPYQSFSTFAGNPYFIDLDLLAKAGLLQPEEYESIDWESTPGCVNYGALYQKRYAVLHKACARLLAAPPADYADFLAKNAFWLPDYALFMALKERRYQLTPPSSRFYLVHFSGEFLLDTLAQADVVRTESHIPQKINALAQGKHALVLLHIETDPLNGCWRARL